MPVIGQWLTTTELARKHGVSYLTAYRVVTQDMTPRPMQIGGRWVVQVGQEESRFASALCARQARGPGGFEKGSE